MRRHIPILALLTLGAWGVACTPTDSSPEASNATVYVNASIWTGVAGAERATALAVQDGRLIAVGPESEVEPLKQAGARVVDLEGAFVVPGFIDNHTHFLSGGFGLASVDLRDAATPEEFARRVGEFASTQVEDRWILEGDWDHELWGGELPHKAWIDEVTPTNPVFVSRLDGHMALANSRAIELAGVTAETPDPPGGEIVRDENGEPAGVFKDAAMALIGTAITPRTDDEYDAALNAGIAHAVERGVTQIHDMGGWRNLAAFQRARAADRLALRVYSFVPLGDWERAAAYVAENGRGDDHLRWGALKGYVDGSLGSTTAWFYEPYDDAPETSGLLLQDTEALKGWLIGADAAGLHVTIHAIGDQANDWLLDAFEETVARNGAFDSELPERRFRIEHAQHLSPEAIDRFRALNVIASMQPYHAIDDGRWAEKRIGPDRIQRTYAFRSLLDAGATLTFGSDWTVAPIEPLQGIYAAVTRRTIDDANPDGWIPDQRISVEEALRAYTSANAFAGYQESDLGTLELGKLADFVALSEDLLEIDPLRIPDVRVLRTVIGGEDKFVADR